MANKNLFLESKCIYLLMSKGFPVLTRKTIALILTVLLILSGPGIASAEWVDKIIDVGVVTQYDDNINRSFFSSVEKDDVMVVPSASVGRVYQLADFTRLSATADVKGEIHEELDFLNSVFAGATLAASHKLGVGPYKPWLRVHGSGGYLEVDDDLRDSWLFDTGIKIGKRLTERVDIAAGYTYDFRDSRQGDAVPGTNLPSSVFDQDGHTGSILANILFTNNLLFSLGYSFRYGDIVSTCDAEIVGKVLDEVDAVTFDKAFEEAFDVSPSCAYRIQGDTHAFSVGTTYALSNHSFLNLNYHRKEGEASRWDYSNNIVNISFNYSFQ